MLSILAHSFGPTAIPFGQMLLQGPFQPVQHTATFLIMLAIFLIRFPGVISFQMGHIEMMDSFGGFTTTSFHPFDLVSNMSIVILLSKLSRRTRDNAAPRGQKNNSEVGRCVRTSASRALKPSMRA